MVSVPRSPPEPLTQTQLDVLTGHRVDLGALGGGVAAGVVGVLGVAAQPVGSLDQRGHGGVVLHD